ncbi:ferric reductase family protein [Aspergillus homomorphus CBS 101889]|uniref:Putative ferric-chelate reductase n=1 Tax=Aspergillus homomorphus (strain CBS 101889) TaxID=1450537 RepID=A0A395I1S9_ASPHC|nr:putative ferric-chelate reductase [Aspergillus homomorphus CBS 101889]RAL13695.1 putative ferric-chelate reductase [Aspergillus homomorphus CBS 101889]
MGLPWLDQPVMLHSSRADSCKLTTEQCAYRSGHWRYWYQSDHVYALNTIYFLCATVGVFMIVRILAKYSPVSVRRTAVWRKATATGRYLAYKSFRLPCIFNFPSLGVPLLIIVGAIFFFAMTLGPKPYYWPNTETVSYGGSPPIATRAGWMALGLLPFVLALGAKANLISALTGVTHEKLQVFHHWTSYAMFVLALVHTFPFIIVHIQKGDMMKQWRTEITYWTGVAALIPQAYLTIMSLPAVRNRFYEFFKATHLLAAFLFILFFFFHCDFRLSSWDYFIATVAIYLLSLLISFTKTHLIHGRHRATFELLPCGFLRITVPTVTVVWRPAQHVFIRFLSPRLGLHSLTAHPFTITTTSASKQTPNGNLCPSLTFYIQPRAGITGRLAQLARRHPGFSMPVLLEGPYGGISHDNDLARFNHVILVTGGSGGGFSLGILEELIPRQNPQNHTAIIIFATRSPAVAEWYQGELNRILLQRFSSPESVIDVHIDIYITSPSPSASPSPNPPKEIPQPSNPNTTLPINLHPSHRPDLPHLLSTTVPTTQGPSNEAQRIGIFTCGPASMVHDVRNAAAEAQFRYEEGVEEVYLHTEMFS